MNLVNRLKQKKKTMNYIRNASILVATVMCAAEAVQLETETSTEATYVSISDKDVKILWNNERSDSDNYTSWWVDMTENFLVNKYGYEDG